MRDNKKNARSFEESFKSVWAKTFPRAVKLPIWDFLSTHLRTFIFITFDWLRYCDYKLLYFSGILASAALFAYNALCCIISDWLRKHVFDSCKLPGIVENFLVINIMSLEEWIYQLSNHTITVVETIYIRKLKNILHIFIF